MEELHTVHLTLHDIPQVNREMWAVPERSVNMLFGQRFDLTRAAVKQASEATDPPALREPFIGAFLILVVDSMWITGNGASWSNAEGEDVSKETADDKIWQSRR
jgi:hypothetical protein